jgi:hypothetical protein
MDWFGRSGWPRSSLSDHLGPLIAPRSQPEVSTFFAGLELVDPGVVPMLAWRPDDGTPPDPLAARSHAGTGRKP